MLTGAADVESAAAQLASAGAAGDRHAWARTGRSPRARRAPSTCRASPVDVVDTTGAGDLFAAAYVWADHWGAPLEQRLRWAVLYASLSVRVATAVAGAVTLRALLEEGAATRADVASATAVGSDEGGQVKARSVFAALALTALAAVGCGAPGDDGDDTASQATPAATAAAKPDIAALGDVTLTIWDQEVRGGQKAQIEELTKQFEAKYPNVTVERISKSFEDTLKTVKLARVGPERARHRPGQPGPRDDGRARQGQAAAPARRLREGLRLGGPLLPDAARPQPVLAGRQRVRLRRPVRALADGRDRRRLLQQGEGADAAGDAGRVRGVAGGGQGRGRDADHVRQPREVAGHPQLRERARAVRRQAGRARLRVREGGRVVRHAGVPGSRREDPGVGRQGLLQQELQRHGLRPGVAGSSRRATAAI